MNPSSGEKPPLQRSSTSHDCRSVSWSVVSQSAAARPSPNKFTSLPWGSCLDAASAVACLT